MKHLTRATKAAIVKYQRLCAKLEGYPCKGVHVGGGKHVELGNEAGPGWTTQHDGIRQHPKLRRWSIRAVDVSMRRCKRLTDAEKESLKTYYRSAVKLDETWTVEDEDIR